MSLFKWIPWEKQQTFPDTKLTDLFSTVKPYTYTDPGKIKPSGERVPMDKGAWYMIGTYMSISSKDHASLTVTASPMLSAWIKNNMLAIEYNTLHFSATVWPDRRVLVQVCHGSIIGARCLRIVPLDEFNEWCGLNLEPREEATGDVAETP